MKRERKPNINTNIILVAKGFRSFRSVKSTRVNIEYKSKYRVQYFYAFLRPYNMPPLGKLEITHILHPMIPLAKSNESAQLWWGFLFSVDLGPCQNIYFLNPQLLRLTVTGVYIRKESREHNLPDNSTLHVKPGG